MFWKLMMSVSSWQRWCQLHVCLLIGRHRWCTADFKYLGAAWPRVGSRQTIVRCPVGCILMFRVRVVGLGRPFCLTSTKFIPVKRTQLGTSLLIAQRAEANRSELQTKPTWSFERLLWVGKSRLSMGLRPSWAERDSEWTSRSHWS